MSAAKSIYDDKPWQAAYGQHIQVELPSARYRNLAHLASEACRRFEKRTAFTCVVGNGMNGSLSYAEVDELSDAFAGYLRGVCGLAAGDRVAVQLPNSLSYPVVAFGVFKAGCVLVNTNPLYTPSEMIHQFNDAGASVLVVVDMFSDKLAEVVPKTGIKRVVLAGVSEMFPAIPNMVVRGVQKVWSKTLPPVPRLAVPVERLADTLQAGRKTLPADGVRVWWEHIPAASVAALQYTGGTTGVSKGAMLSHANLLANVDQVLAMGRSHMSAGDGSQECVLTALPLYHIFAFTANLLTFFDIGARNILVPTPRPVQNLQRAIENYPITWITGVNTLFNGLMNEEWFSAFPPKHLKAAIAGGTALHGAVAARWQGMTGTRVAEGYGLTETSPVITFNPMTGTARPDSIGIPVPGCEVRLVADDGSPAPVGQPGELAVRGPQTMLGYWQRPEDTALVIKDGWLYTGDVAVMDESGFFRVVDRKKDLVLVSGFNVYPNEVEEALSKLDAIFEAAVVGIPDSRSGEAVRAYVVKNPEFEGELTQEMVITHCRSLLTDYKIPKSIVFRNELPKSPIGKILRKDLKAEVKAEHAQPSATAR
ncbi:MAG: AMP-binding protein [Polaromonas sp.]|uniref:AMP-binding protein n=1 Tax=Polaromonas sp. TaxID=1869339 RepID=UPI0017C724D6|nr:AMP-binding protein [Polaromonas sp.]MBA3592354.1 AMP-binding protein [Polaromonas sp.]